MGRSAHSAGPGLTPRRSDTRLAPLASRRRSWRVIDKAHPRPIENGPARPLVDDSGGAQSLVPGRVSASRREGVPGLPRSLAPGPSPGTQPRPRNPAPRRAHHGPPQNRPPVTRRTGTTHPPSRSTRTARALADARPQLPRPPLLPLPRPLRPQLPSRRLDGSTRPAPRPATHRTAWPVSSRLDPVPPPRPQPRQHPTALARPAFSWRVEEGSPRQKQRTPFLESPGGKRKNRPGAGRRPVGLLGPTSRDQQPGTNSQKPTTSQQGPGCAQATSRSTSSAITARVKASPTPSCGSSPPTWTQRIMVRMSACPSRRCARQDRRSGQI
jgi:hypothetical protein